SPMLLKVSAKRYPNIVQIRRDICSRAIQVDLEGYIQAAATFLIGRKPEIDVVALAIQGHGCEMRATAGAFKLPRQMVPASRSGHGATNPRGNPAMLRRIPDPPGVGVFDVTLGPEDIAQPAGILIHVEFQGLSVFRILHAKIKTVTKPVYVVSSANLIPPQARSPNRASRPELSGRSGQRRGGNVLGHGMTGAWPIASPAGTLVTVVPARVILYLGDIRMYLFTPRTIADDTDVKLVDLHLARWAPRLHGDVVVS